MMNKKQITLLVVVALAEVLVMVGLIAVYHMTMQGRYYDLRGVRTPENCEQIDQVILYPGRDSVAIICEVKK